MKLGEVLVAQGTISGPVLEEALVLQHSLHDKIGRILIGLGKLNFLELHRALAAQKNLPFLNLMEEEIQPQLIEQEKKSDYFRYEYIPWKRENGALIIACSDETEGLKKHLRATYIEPFRLVIASPVDIHLKLRQFFKTEQVAQAREALWKAKPTASAKELFEGVRFRRLILPGVIFALWVLYDWFSALTALIVLVNALYAATLIFKGVIFVVGMWMRKREYRERVRDRFSYQEIEEKALPVYSILVPLYKESEITIRHLLRALGQLDYPKSKLDIKLIVEEDDESTKAILQALTPARYFEIIVVPVSYPRTKPKACNYALQFARGAYITIYDAEDVPDPMQLKKSVAAYQRGQGKIGCVQARLNYYNRDENILTRMFALEYGMWFQFMLKGLERLKLPIPLGGTSNHIPRYLLMQLHAWDPYNVTEDADFGIRLAEEGFETRMLDSETLEEAPHQAGAWIRQRSRWIKGYIQTFVVHLREPRYLLKKLNWKGFIGFFFFIGMPAFLYVTTPFFLALAAFSYVQELPFPAWLTLVLWSNLFGGLLLHLGIAVVVMAANRWWRMLPYILIFPFYWLMHVVASFRAIWSLIKQPHHWDKTAHGVSRILPGV